ncbi:MAG: ferritin [Ignavibacteriales bacterium]|nr:ferritin [Ignavibacteriales bacterium]
MIPKKIQDAINEQIMHEFSSSYVYLSMSAYFQSTNLPGFAHWLMIQSREEYSHALKLYNHVIERGGKVELENIPKPKADFNNPLDVMKKVFEHEQKVTALIHALYELAVKEKDYPAQVMLQWFIEEQVEEEKNANEVIHLLKQVGEAPAGLIMLDRQLAARKAE